MHVAAIIVAAGHGKRAGGSEPKQFVDLGNGRTMLSMCIDAFTSCADVNELVVAVPVGFTPHVSANSRVVVVEGGARRQDSMTNAFGHVSPEADIVLVHDAARPFVSVALISRTIAAAHQHGAAIAALPVRDTVKRTEAAQGSRTIRETLPRDDIFLAQTPQGFRRDVLEHALAAGAALEVTDEAMLVERMGVAVHIVEGEPTNVKVTTPEDVAYARTSVQTARIGTGYDLHRLVPDRTLVLAGVRIPYELGLEGHSDADVVCHAVTDAILGAAALGDIGQLFPDSDPQWKDADSLRLLESAVRVLADEGYRIGNVDVTVIAERPKLLPYLNEMRANLARALGIDVRMVSIKGKTNERVDAAGRGEAMACHAVALIASRGWLSGPPRENV